MSGRAFEFKRVPAELRGLPRWVLWKLEPRDGRMTKVPYFERDGKLYGASTTDPATWLSFPAAIEAGRRHRTDGLGFVFDPRDGYTGVDLDHCRDPETGEIEQWADAIVQRLDSYTENSQSGLGLHVLIKGKLPEGGRRKGPVEMYDQGRYFVMTGAIFDGRDQIEERQAEIEELHAAVFEEDEHDGDAPTTTAAKAVTTPALTDDEVIERAQKAANGGKFQALWSGSTTGYTSHSEADLALCSLLAFWCRRDEAQIDRLFRRSGLMRSKWHGQYAAYTIKKATAGGEVYDPTASEAGDPLTLEQRAQGYTVAQAVESNPLPSAPDPLEGLRALPESADPTAIETALRDMAGRMNGSDPLKRGMIREAAVKELRRLGVSSPASLADAAIPRLDAATADDRQGRAFAIPEVEPWPDRVGGGELLDEITATIRRFVKLPAHAAETSALWVVFTYCLDVADIAPYLVLTSPEKRCGKSTLLSLLGAFVCRPIIASNISSAALFRVIELHSPTLLVDEADTFVRPSKDGAGEELRGILNSGHTRATAQVIRCTGEDQEPRAFSTWGAKLLALIGELPSTLTDRSIVLRLRRKGPGEACERLRRRRLADLGDIRRKCARWAADHLDELRGRETILTEIHDRAADNWEPLLNIADLAGGKWPELARGAARGLSGAEADDQTAGVMLLADLEAMFTAIGGGKAGKELFTTDILTELAGLTERPWSEWSHGKPITARGLARLLKPFGIASGTVRVNSKTGKGYDRADCEDTFARYLADTGNYPSQRHKVPNSLENKGENSVTDSKNDSENVTDNSEPTL